MHDCQAKRSYPYRYRHIEAREAGRKKRRGPAEVPTVVATEPRSIAGRRSNNSATTPTWHVRYAHQCAFVARLALLSGLRRDRLAPVFHPKQLTCWWLKQSTDTDRATSCPIMATR
ncbi:hypothetical protein L1887_57053 [Cichorium endivia]|nr:hypothetical protein L1887_57053 [Cichorium endivia]